VNASIKTQVERNLRAPYDTTAGALFFKLYANDSLIADSYPTGNTLECTMLHTFENDTINITGFVGFALAFGFQITLSKDTCIVRHYTKADDNVYRLHPNDPPTSELFVPCKSYTLRLTSQPRFRKGETIEGMVELVSDDYDAADNDHKGQCRMQLTSYFKVRL
jgi:hypothetical protein